MEAPHSVPVPIALLWQMFVLLEIFLRAEIPEGPRSPLNTQRLTPPGVTCWAHSHQTGRKEGGSTFPCSLARLCSQRFLLRSRPPPPAWSELKAVRPTRA